MGKVDENKHQKMDALFQSAYDLFLNQGGSLTVEYLKKYSQAAWYLHFLCQIFCFIL